MKTDPQRIRELYGKLLKAPLHKFPEARGRIEAPDARGVYIIYGPRGLVCHVGCAPRGKKGIAQRLRNHLATSSSFTVKYLPLKGDGKNLRQRYSYRFLEVDDPRLLILLESYAVGTLCPAHIGLHQLQA